MAKISVKEACVGQGFWRIQNVPRTWKLSWCWQNWALVHARFQYLCRLTHSTTTGEMHNFSGTEKCDYKGAYQSPGCAATPALSTWTSSCQPASEIPSTTTRTMQLILAALPAESSATWQHAGVSIPCRDPVSSSISSVHLFNCRWVTNLVYYSYIKTFSVHPNRNATLCFLELTSRTIELNSFGE